MFPKGRFAVTGCSVSIESEPKLPLSGLKRFRVEDASCSARDMSKDSDAETNFLEQLGQRVRNMRALRGMSRKVLAKVSGISERYIAQLESGKGNVSIVLLRRGPEAPAAHLEDLVPARDGAPDGPGHSAALPQAAASHRPATRGGADAEGN